MTARNWRAPEIRSLQSQGYAGRELLGDCPLLRLAHNVTRFLQGDSRRMLTMAIEHARINNHWSVQLSQFSAYVTQFSIVGPSLPALATVDTTAHDDFRNTYRTAPH
jgi:hypothetical protein